MSWEGPLTPGLVEERFAYDEWDAIPEVSEVPRREAFRRWLAAELAAAWAEGHDAGWDERDDFVNHGAIPSGKHQSEAVNPYLADGIEGGA